VPWRGSGGGPVNLSMIAHDPADGTVRVYQVHLAAIIEPTGFVSEDGRHEVSVRRVDGRDFRGGSIGPALAEVLKLDPDDEPADQQLVPPRTAGGSDIYDREPDPYDGPEVRR
jgi:hypothetical protein